MGISDDHISGPLRDHLKDLRGQPGRLIGGNPNP
jgi:hypothetical protein